MPKKRKGKGAQKPNKQASLVRFLAMNLLVPSPFPRVQRKIDRVMELLAEANSAFSKEDDLFEVRHNRITAARVLGSLYKKHSGPRKVPESEIRLFLSRFLDVDKASASLMKCLRRTKDDLTIEAGAAGGDAKEKFGNSDLAAENIESLFKLLPRHRFAKYSLGAKHFRKLTSGTKPVAWSAPKDWTDEVPPYRNIAWFFLLDVLNYQVADIKKAISVLDDDGLGRFS